MSDKTQQLLNQDIGFEKIDNFFEIFRDFKGLQQQQKMRGLNDFNIFTTVLKKHDEVRLHSRFLTFLLNPNANHNQGDLFLDLFLKQIGLDGFFDNLFNCSVQAEYQNIDIYINDGNKHIIIENKIWAGDQHAQVKRYIKTINEENENLDNANLVVIYLSLDRKKPSRYSLCHNKIENDETNTKENCPNGFYIQLADDKIRGKIIGRGKNQHRVYQFRNLHYNNQINDWLEKSYQQIANISNLSLGISQYQEVIGKLYGTYKEKAMDLSEYLDGKDNKQELLQDMKEISKEFEKYREGAILKFFSNAQDKLRERVGDGWKVFFLEKRLNGKTYQLPFCVSNKDSDNAISLMLDFESKNYHDCYFSIKKKNGEKHGFESDIFKDINTKSLPKLLTRKTQYSIVLGLLR